MAVFGIEAKDVKLKPSVLASLTTYLASQLSESGAFEVVPPDKLKEALVGKKKESYKQCYKQTCQIEIGQELAADKALSTQVMKVGTKCIVTCNLYDLKKSTSGRAATAEGKCTEDGINASLKQAVAKLTAKSTPPPAPPPSAPTPAPSPAPAPEPAPAGRGAAAPSGSVLVDANVSEASVYINGKRVGTTPLIEKLAPGRAVVQVRAKGYQVWERAVLVQTGARTKLTADLKKEQIELRVVSNPADASVLVDGQLVGRTPLRHSLDPGDHFVTIRHPGYADWTSVVKAKLGQRVEVAATLTHR